MASLAAPVLQVGLTQIEPHDQRAPCHPFLSPSLQVGFNQNELQDSAFTFFSEANKVLGVDVPTLMQDNGIELQYVGEAEAGSQVHKSVVGELLW